MKSLVFKNIGKCYGKTEVVKGFNLEIEEGERLILLGPSGCGKTTTLRMIAGLEDITSGELIMNGQVINDVPPGERNIAMVFQSYALFPHLSVWDNITFGLKIQKLSEEEISKRTKEALKILNLENYANHKPKELSGGQKQRVALCRALVKQSPFFLLDEPLSNLDAQLRQQARTELVKIHAINKPTMIYVTHDQIEAMTVATKIAIMNKGYLQQVGTPDEIYHKPANTFVASFIGTPPMNLLKAKVQGSNIVLGTDTIAVPSDRQGVLAGKSEVVLGIRPERCEPSATPMIGATMDYMENLGNQLVIRMQAAGEQVLQVCTGEINLDVQAVRGVDFDWADACLFDAETEDNLE